MAEEKIVTDMKFGKSLTLKSNDEQVIPQKLYLIPDFIETRVGEWKELTLYNPEKDEVNLISNHSFSFKDDKENALTEEKLINELKKQECSFKFLAEDEGDTLLKVISKDGTNATCTIRVLPVVTLSKSTLTIVKGQSYSLNAAISVSEGTLTWVSDNVDSVSVDNGVVKGEKVGTAKVTAEVTMLDNKVFKASCTVVVEETYRDVISGYMDKFIPLYDESTVKYNLTFDFENEYDDTVNSETFTLIQGKETNISISKSYVRCLLTDVSFHKEIYKPGYVEVKIKTDAKLDVFKGKISLGYGDIHTIVAENFYIFEKRKKNGYVVLKAYSVDIFLTIDKGNRAFTAKKMLEGIVVKTLANMQMTDAGKQYYANVTQKDKEGNEFPSGIVGNLNHIAEYFIPYCVQYEESFYDFLLRICNRNGEFLYCEDNMLHVGAKLDESSEKEITDSMTDAEIEYIELDCLYDATVSNECIYPKEYFDAIHNFDDSKFEAGLDSEFTYVKWSDYMPPVSTALGYLKTISQAPTLNQGLVGGLIKSGLQSAISGYFWDSTNKKFRETYFKGKTNDEIECVYQFSGTDKQLNENFYQNIFKKEEKAKRGQVIVTFATCRKYKLGEKVKLNDEYYVVYRVKGSSKIIDTILESDSTKRYNETYELLLLPEIDGKYYPLPMPELRIRRSAPQKAIVTNPMDPKRRGRVQVMYPWQKEKSDFTPWLNIAYPKASDGEGFMFIPNPGDVVLIDYEEGNIERPFMVGSFYGDGREPSVPSATYQVGLTKSITSANGHHLSFTDVKGDTKFFAELVPFWSIVSKFGVGLNAHDEVLKKNGKFLAGGFELSDYFGIYKIKGCTHDRNITISSPVGDVKIDAFTGITIEAPAGDINILGKNINIEARNNLTMVSGTNIISPYVEIPTKKDEIIDVLKGMTGELAGGLFIGAIKKVLGLDLSFYRVLFEVLLRPIGGTMLIKSHRFMRMEAGDGKTQITKTVDKTGKDIKKDLSNYVFGNAFAAINDPKDDINKNLDDIVFAVTSIFGLIKEYLKLMDAVVANVRSALRWDAVDPLIGDKIAKCARLGLDEGDYLTNPFIDNAMFVPLVNTRLKAVNESFVKMNEYGNAVAEFRKNKMGVWRNEMNKMLDKKAEALMDWMMNKGAGEINNVLIDVSVANQKKCVFEEIQNYVRTHDDLKLSIDMNSSLVDFETLIGLHQAVKVANVVGTNIVNPSKGDIALGAVSKFLGFDGMVDNRVWSQRDKGGIIISTNKDRFFNFTNDGTFRQGYMVDVVEYIKDLIKSLK